MPDQHCPTCGTARSAGCRCLPDPGLTETAVLPHLEGPPLVRPYVPQAVGQVADTPPPAGATDPFATSVLPPVPHAPPHAPPLGPDADAYATTVLPPVMSAPQPTAYQQTGHQQTGHQQQPYRQGPQPHDDRPYDSGRHGSGPYDSGRHDDGQPPAAGDEIGLFPFDRTAPAGAAGPAEGTGGRAARRAAEQAEEGSPGRRKGLLIAAGAGLLALTVGLAYAVAPSGEPEHQAQPAPTTSLAPAPADPTTPAEPSPSAPPSTSDAPSPSASRTARPSPTRTTAPPATATTPPAAPPAPVVTTPPAPSPTPTPTPTPTATTPTPTASPTFQALKYGDKGAGVKEMQRKLSVVLCWMSIPQNGSFDSRTETSVQYFQVMQGVQGDESGVYGPNTAAALAKRTTC
ncbi:peptidoglycan-binding protein [Kitasatospora sp. NBC_01560]|uniref:peptidoglycan-binding protein n=1 Tax=Kitasatospora sp. NBC_01560 TaxID=2975965 RepID=UPI00386722A1